MNPPRDATRPVELVNAVYLSASTGRPVPLPLDTDAYEDLLGRLRSGKASIGPACGAGGDRSGPRR